MNGSRLHHSWIFAGADATITERIAVTFAAALLCVRSSDEACGICGPCLRVASRTHPDLAFVAAEGEGATRLIKIAAIREVLRTIALRPLEGDRRVVLVSEADRMNKEAQNALLKTLEEPPAAVSVLLVAQRAQALLPTIRSRCLTVTVPVPRVVPPLVEEVRESVRAAGNAGVRGLLELSERWASEKGDLVAKLDALAVVMRDRALSEARAHAATARGLAGALLVAEARRALEGYGNARLTIDCLLLKLRSEGAL